MALSQEDIVRALFAARPRISASVWLVVRDTQTAEDIFQDTSIKALTKGGPFQTMGHLLSWAQVTARHAAIDWLRQRRPDWITLEGDVLELLEAQAMLLPERSRVDALRECLEAVPPRSRQMLELRYFDGRSCDQVTQALGIKLSAVYQRLSRLHGALKECIERRMAGNPAISADRQKLVRLKEGALFFSVTPQPHDRPMLIRTAMAEMEVLGTVFALTARPEQTVLNVDQGRVRLRRLADGQSVDVVARQAVVASLDTKAKLQATTPQPPPRQWQLDLSSSPPSDWRGDRLPADAEIPARLRVVPCPAGPRDKGMLRVFHGIAARGLAASNGVFVSLTADSVLRLRFRTEKRTALQVFLSTRRPTGAFGGNFEVPIPAKDGLRKPDGWRYVEVPLARCSALQPHRAKSPDGLEVALLFINSYQCDAGLDIAELAISDTTAGK